MRKLSYRFGSVFRILQYQRNMELASLFKFRGEDQKWKSILLLVCIINIIGIRAFSAHLHLSFLLPCGPPQLVVYIHANNGFRYFLDDAQTMSGGLLCLILP